MKRHFPGKWNKTGFVLAARIRRGSFSLPKDKFLDEKYKEFFMRERYIYLSSIVFFIAYFFQFFVGGIF